jgi:hypothetical protein
VTAIDLTDNGLDESVCAIVDIMLARNRRFRCLLLFDARRVLLSRLCNDEVGVVWSYFLASFGVDADDGAAPGNIEWIRVELAAFVDERCRRELSRPALVSDVRTLHDAHRQTRQDIVALNNTVAEQTTQIVAQTTQIADLQRLAHILVEQNQQIQEKNREMRALLVTRNEH